MWTVISHGFKCWIKCHYFLNTCMFCVVLRHYFAELLVRQALAGKNIFQTCLMIVTDRQTLLWGKAKQCCIRSVLTLNGNKTVLFKARNLSDYWAMPPFLSRRCHWFWLLVRSAQFLHSWMFKYRVLTFVKVLLDQVIDIHFFYIFVYNIITIIIENRIKSNTNFGHVLRAFFYTYCYYNFNPWGIFAHMTSFSLIRNRQALEQGQVMAAVNSRE